uniref:Uncharacterized protein n=1 Tax=Anguilla anguilla TaxID=7936 RepID=A0A0E9V4D0_ANGAN
MFQSRSSLHLSGRGSSSSLPHPPLPIERLAVPHANAVTVVKGVARSAVCMVWHWLMYSSPISFCTDTFLCLEQSRVTLQFYPKQRKPHGC